MINRFFTVDVEDWFHSANFSKVIKMEDWEHLNPRVEDNTYALLDLLEKNQNKGTFFVLGWVAERFPQIVKRIHDAGHEVASHGTNHECLYDISPERFREDIRASKGLLEDLTGTAILGYRAPNFSITDWGIDILQEEGFLYDSSVFHTILHDRYGKLEKYHIEGDQVIYQLKEGFYELPLSSYGLFSRKLPWAGGAYFRILPYWIFRRGVNRICGSKSFFNFYTHPWEVDTEFTDDGFLSGVMKLRQVINIKKNLHKIGKFSGHFQFKSIRSFLVSENIIEVL